MFDMPKAMKELRNNQKRISLSAWEFLAFNLPTMSMANLNWNFRFMASAV
jgi:hypothetical protein